MNTPHRVTTRSALPGNSLIAKITGLILLTGSLFTCTAAMAANALKDISYSALAGNTVQITLTMENQAEEPLVFTIDDPARIALDLLDTQNLLENKSKDIGIGIVNGFSSAEAKNRTRVVINLADMTTYDTVVNDNNIVLTLGGLEAPIIDTTASPVIKSSTPDKGNQLRNVDFRRGEKGEGLIRVTLPNAKTSVDMRQESGKLIVEFLKVNLPARLQRSLDVKDFATPVYTIDTFQKGANTRMEIAMDSENEHLAYQSNEEFTIEVKSLADLPDEVAKRKKEGFTGEKLSLNFQDIEVRSVLQLLADFTGLNVVVSDTVRGNLTLRLKNVPWDQALDIILKTRGLAKRQTGNVVLIAPAAEIANQERLELEASQQIRELEPLFSEFIQINYADASDFVTLIDNENNSLLSERGSVTVDARTNTLLIRDTATNISEIRALVVKLDIPVKQVLIESRIVTADESFSKSLGVRFGFEKAGLVRGRGGDLVFDEPGTSGQNRTSYTTGGSLDGINLTGPDGTLGENLLVDLPAAGATGTIGLAIGRIGSQLLQLELSAAQAEGRGEVISSPRLVTADKQTASISVGDQIPYQEASSSGATSTSFQDATLSLSVTPQITPDNRVIMDVDVTNDSVGEIFNGVPSINTQTVQSQVIVDNGETIVLGGVYQRTQASSVDRVPFFSDLPYVGWAFRTKAETDARQELLIFVTPKIIKDESSLN
ncbi:MAG: type IV pilus secretin PilQ [Gammaproteobacteria bacterium]|nr:MAG: type IV pilus secretin PilQ [Gammaproteobacteria bacterium]